MNQHKLPVTIVVLILFSPFALGEDEGATSLYDRAQRAHFDLKANSELRGDSSGWQKVVEAYLLVIDSYPNDPLVDDIIFIIGGVYKEMYEHFGDRSYLDRAISYYRTVLRDHPQSYLQQAALFAIGQIQEEHFRQPDQALITYNELIERFPKGYKTASARKRIEVLKKSDSKQTSEKVRSASAEEHIGNKTEDPVEVGASLEPATIKDIRTYFGENSGRVTIELSGEVKFEYEQLPEPNRRIFFDLHNVNIAESKLPTDSIPISNRYLKRIRLGQFSPVVARVVLDFDAFRNYKVFTLPSPFRIVFDLYGAGSGPTYSAAKANGRIEDSPEGARTNLDGSYSLSRQLGAKVTTIVLDPGHGGKDPGAIGFSGLKEKDLTLDIAKRLKVLAEKEMPGITVKLTRSSDTFLPLEKRTALANAEEADMFFSIHANASRRSGRNSGIETYYMNFASDKDAEELAAKENAYSQFNQAKLNDVLKKITLNNKKEESRDLARFVQTNLLSATKTINKYAHNLGVKSAPFVVLIGADIPSVLVEVGFIDHQVEGKLALRSDYRDRIARGLLNGIKAYVESLQ